MAASVNVRKRSKFLNMYAVVSDITLDNSYPTGGYAVTPAQFGLTTFEFVLPQSNLGYVVEFDHTNSKLKMWISTVQVAAAVDLSAVVVRVLAMGE